MAMTDQELELKHRELDLKEKELHVHLEHNEAMKRVAEAQAKMAHDRDMQSKVETKKLFSERWGLSKIQLRQDLLFQYFCNENMSAAGKERLERQIGTLEADIMELLED